MKNPITMKKIVIQGHTFLDPSEAPGYDPKTGTYRGLKKPRGKPQANSSNSESSTDKTSATEKD